MIAILLLLAIGFGLRSWLVAARAKRLEGQREELLHDVDVMQAALVPALPAQLDGLAVSVAYRPADGPAAGGDFYDMFIPAEGKVAIILGDVCGHGCEALTHAALTRYTLRAYLQAGLEPRAALALAGQALADPTGERYATVAVGVYEAENSQLTYASAGHPHPLLQGVELDQPLTICSSPPIGWGVPTGRRQTTVSLPSGSAACFFSDGLVEARSDGQLLGRERLAELLTGLGLRPQAGDLLEQVSQTAEAIPDDMAACIVEPAAGAKNVPWLHVEELEVDRAVLGGANVRRFLDACHVSAPESTRALTRAHDIVAQSGTALLRIELASARTSVDVTPGTGSPQSTDARLSQQPSAPLLRALVTS